MGSAAAQSLLRGALPFVASRGFTYDAILASHPSQVNEASLRALFPSPTRSTRASTLVCRPLLQFWLSEQAKHAQLYLDTVEKNGRDKLLDGITERLRLNEPVIDALKDVWSPADAAEYAKHVYSTSHALCWSSFEFKDLQGEGWHLERARCASVYAASEMFQLSDKSPSFRGTYHLLNRLYQSSEDVRSGVHEVGLFGSYVMQGWQSLYKSRYF